MISRGGAQWRRVRRGQLGTPTLFLKLLGGGMEPPIDVPQNFRNI